MVTAALIALIENGLELTMRRRRNRKLWNLTIDKFAGYVAREGSVKTLAHVFSEGRKFRMSITVAHQDCKPCEGIEPSQGLRGS